MTPRPDRGRAMATIFVISTLKILESSSKMRYLKSQVNGYTTERSPLKHAAARGSTST